MNKFIKQHIRDFLLYAAVFSFFINILMLTLPLYMVQVFDRVITSQSNETLLMLSLAAVFALLVSWALDLLRARLMQSAGVVLDEKLGRFALSGVLKRASQMDGKEYAQNLRDVSVLRNFLTGQSLFSLFDTPWMVFYIIIIFLFHPLLGWVALASAILLFALAVLNEKITKPPLQEASAAARKSSKFIDTALRNAEAVSAMGMQPGVERHWQGMNAQVLTAQVQAADRSSLMVTATKTLRQLIQVIMLGLGAWLVIRQHVTPGVMMASTLILSRALAPVESAITSWKQFVDARESYENLSKLLKADAETQSMQLPAPEGKLTVERLVAGAPNSNRAVIKGISFEVLAGESVGIIGPSAAGKSTLVRLLAGIWKPASGNVRLDGADIATWPREQVGPYIGYLPQDVELFSGTISENIARLQPHQDNAEAIIEAAKLAGVHEMILRLPQGYDTEIGEGGLVLSGGQRQRIGLARALFGNPALILLDEPNSNLDNEGEEQLGKALIALKQAKKTIIVVTHKPSALGFVDKILVLRDGTVDMFGSRQEVMARVTRPNVVNLAAGQEMQQHG